MWIPQAEALFDIRVVDTDAQSYRNRAPIDILSTAEREKAKYHQACVDRRAFFTPLCLFVDGLRGREAAVFVKRMAERLSSNWDINYSLVLGWIRTQLSFSILRATILCLRGSCTKWCSFSVTDEAPIHSLCTDLCLRLIIVIIVINYSVPSLSYISVYIIKS